MPTSDDIVVTATPAPLGTGLCDAIQLEADSGNGDDIFWGDKILQNMKLAPGERQVVPAHYLEEVFLRSASGNQILHYSFV